MLERVIAPQFRLASPAAADSAHSGGPLFAWKDGHARQDHPLTPIPHRGFHWPHSKKPRSAARQVRAVAQNLLVACRAVSIALIGPVIGTMSYFADNRRFFHFATA